MHRPARFWLLLILLGLLPALTEANQELPRSPLDSLPVHASRAASSLLLYRGEGFQSAYLLRLDRDIRALDATLQRLERPSAELRAAHRALLERLREGAAFGPAEDDMPWGWPLQLSKTLREFLAAVRAEPDAGASRNELPAKLEYLAVQYLSRAYIGSFEIAREQPDSYLGQDERALVPSIDSQLAGLQLAQPAALAKLRSRWAYLRVALADMNSASNHFTTASGRPFAPIMVDRHTRGLSAHWVPAAP